MPRTSFSNNRGFTALELLIAVVVALILLSVSGVSIMKAYEIKWKNETQNNLTKLVNAFKSHYLEMRQAAEDPTQPFFWNDRAILPLVVDSQSGQPDLLSIGSKLRVYTPVASFYEAGCKFSRVVQNTVEVECYDEFGTPLSITAQVQRLPSSKSSYSDLKTPYFNPALPVEIQFRSAGPDKQMNTSDDLTVMFSSLELDTYYIHITENKLHNVLQAVKDFHGQRLYTETVELTYENSLVSYDDVKVPWVWQLFASGDPKTKCVISNVTTCRPTNSCVCPYGQSAWPTNGYSEWDNNHFAYSQYAFRNLGYIQDANSVMKDTFGMPVILIPIKGWTSAPPVPFDRYSWVMSPPYISVVKTSWGMEKSIALSN